MKGETRNQCSPLDWFMTWKVGFEVKKASKLVHGFERMNLKSKIKISF
jgi:hypothetical protein